MSRIVIDAREYTTSTGRYMFRLLQYLERLDEQNEYMLLLKPADMDVYDYRSPNFHKVACPHKEFTFGEQLGLLRQITDLKPDLVHFGKDHQPVLYRGKVVTTMHDLTTARFRNTAKNPVSFTLKQLVYKQVVRHVARKSLYVITPTEYVKQDMVAYSGISPDKVVVTYESADTITDDAQPVAGLEGKPFLMYVGRPQPHKNLGRLLEAFKLLKQTHPDLRLVLAGKKDTLYEQYERQVAERGIRDIIFTGFISEGQLRWLYEHCQAYIVPSLSEGFGLPGLEAMRHGAPVVSSNATCLPEVYGNAAAYFDPLDIRDMAARIAEVIDDPARRQAMIDKGRVHVDGYSWERMAKQTLQVYRTVLGQH